MIRKTLLALALTAGSVAGLSTPAHATWFHKHYCGCGDNSGKGMCGSTSSSGGSTTTSGGSTTGGSTSGGSTSGGTAVPEPGMLGMMGMGLLGLAYARRRQSRK